MDSVAPRSFYHRQPDFCGFERYLVGAWKRTLQWREFGNSFSHLRSSNSIIVCEEHAAPTPSPPTAPAVDAASPVKQRTRCVRWSFGKVLSRKDLHFGFIMQLTNDGNDIKMNWQYKGIPCQGQYHAISGIAVLTFFLQMSSVVVTYCILDADTMSVCIVEVDEHQRSTIQYGTMFRLDLSLYLSTKSVGAGTDGNEDDAADTKWSRA